MADYARDVVKCKTINQFFNNNNNNNNNSNDNKYFPLKHGYPETWTWSKVYRSSETVLSGENNRTVLFHPEWSSRTAGIRGEQQLNNKRYFWELHVGSRVFGTSIMFGIGTRHAPLNFSCFTNGIGQDKHGWGLSHKGVLWHNGQAHQYTKKFIENQATVIGILFDGVEGTLTYYKDGKNLGVAFCDLNKVKEPLYPIVCSTAAKSEITLKSVRREFVNLQDRCRAEIVKHIRFRKGLSKLQLPKILIDYLDDAYSDTAFLREIDDYCSYLDF